MASLIGQKNKTLNASYSIDTKYSGQSSKKTWSITYYVLAASGDDEDDVVSCPGVPILYEVYRNGYCIGKTLTETTVVQGGALWEVNCNFDSHIEADIPVVDVSWDIEEKDEVIKFDAITGVPILNSAYEMIITTAPISIPILTLSRIEPDFSASRILQFNNHINQYTFMGAPPGCVLLMGPSARKKIIKGSRKWEVSYRFKFNMKINPQSIQPQGWRLFLLDHGTRYFTQEFDADNDETVTSHKFKTDEEKDDETGNLNGYGGKLTEGAPEVYLGYNRYAIANFNTLGLEG